jgi:DNA mismatch repair ATPase MutL
LDADANKIEIKFVSNGTTIESIEISDNGDGIQFN